MVSSAVVVIVSYRLSGKTLAKRKSSHHMPNAKDRSTNAEKHLFIYSSDSFLRFFAMTGAALLVILGPTPDPHSSHRDQTPLPSLSGLAMILLR